MRLCDLIYLLLHLIISLFYVAKSVRFKYKDAKHGYLDIEVNRHRHVYKHAFILVQTR